MVGLEGLRDLEAVMKTVFVSGSGLELRVLPGWWALLELRPVGAEETLVRQSRLGGRWP